MLKDFFDIKSRKTSDEILNKTEAVTVPFFEEKYKDAKPQVDKMKMDFHTKQIKILSLINQH